jgi:hypothetical protein
MELNSPHVPEGGDAGGSDLVGRRFKVLSCEIFFREICAVVSRSPHRIDLEFLPKGLHDIGAKKMSERLQEAVDRLVDPSCEAILLGYGLCNNGLAGLEAREIPLVVPRAHDCITLFLGSGERYLNYFNDNPGVYFQTTGWIERGEGAHQLAGQSIQHQFGMDLTYEALVKKYGEENAKYLYEELHGNEKHYKKFTFIEMGVEPDDRFERRTAEKAQQRGWQWEKVKGDLGYLQRLVDGEWSEKEFLIVPPRHRIVAHYAEGLISAEKADA